MPNFRAKILEKGVVGHLALLSECERIRSRHIPLLIAEGLLIAEEPAEGDHQVEPDDKKMPPLASYHVVIMWITT